MVTLIKEDFERWKEKHFKFFTHPALWCRITSHEEIEDAYESGFLLGVIMSAKLTDLRSANNIAHGKLAESMEDDSCASSIMGLITSE